MVIMVQLFLLYFDYLIDEPQVVPKCTVLPLIIVCLFFGMREKRERIITLCCPMSRGVTFISPFDFKFLFFCESGKLCFLDGIYNVGLCGAKGL